jgi:hypothetical protein
MAEIFGVDWLHQLEFLHRGTFNGCTQDGTGIANQYIPVSLVTKTTFFPNLERRLKGERRRALLWNLV